MDEQLDNDLSNRIREVFDNFDDTSFPSADEGWLLLRKNFPETEKKRPVAWLWWASTAAALLLFLSIGLWITGKKQQTNTLALKPVKKHTEQTITTDSATILAATPNPVTKNNAPDTGAAPLAGTKKSTIQAAPYKPAAVPAVPGTTTTQAPAYAKTNVNPTTQVLANTQAAPAIKAKPAADSTKNIIAKTNAPQYVAAAKNPNTTVTDPAKKTKPVDSTKAVMAKANTQQPPVTAPAATTSGSIMLPKQPAKAPKNSMEALFASEQAQQPQKNKQESVEDKKVRFGIYAATFFNYAKGSNNQVNAGAGVTSDIRLSKNLKLSTGLMLAQNTLSYNGGPPPSSNLDALARTPQALAPYDKESLFAANASFPVLKNYNANLIGLDIPINIKYEFNPQKTDAYVSAGLSSGTFINEAYTSVYGYSAGASTQTTDDVTRKSFNSFYFAKTLNVSFGIGYPVGKGNRLIVEPFLKYPLDGLGSQQIQFGSAGLNLKLNFTTKKK